MNSSLSNLIKSIQALQRRPSKLQAVRFAISLALAILLWGWVTQVQDPYITKTISDVPILQGELPETLQVVSTLPNARVTVAGAESRVDPVRLADVSVTMDTSGITGPGTFRVPLIVTTPDVSKRSVEPREVSIQVDERVSEIFPLHVTYTDSADQTRTVGSIEPEVTQVTVTGPKTAVDRVADIVLEVPIDQQTQSFNATYLPFAVDSDGQRVSEVVILPDAIETHVNVKTRGKAVSVIAIVTGVPAEGFSIQQRRALPDTIVVDGPAEELADLLFINTDPVDVTDANRSISTTVGLADLPEGVTILDPPNGTVEVRVAIEDTSTSSQPLSNLSVEPVGLGEGLTATFDPAEVSIQVSASLDILQAMTPDDISVQIDLTGLGPGTYRLPPNVAVPQGATWLSIEPANVLVTITESGPPSPVAASPPAASPQP